MVQFFPTKIKLKKILLKNVLFFFNLIFNLDFPFGVVSERAVNKRTILVWRRLYYPPQAGSSLIHSGVGYYGLH